MQVELKPGMRFPTWQVIAANDAVDSRNPIHHDAVAKSLGFGGGLVPGVTVYGYITHPLVAQFGREFLTTGSLDVRFRRPVYEGETVSVTVEVLRCVDQCWQLELGVTNAAGEVCALGTAQFPASAAGFELPPLAPLPAQRRPATPDALRAAPVLGTFEPVFDVALMPKFLATLGETLALYNDFVHPAWLLRQANYLIDKNVELGPWIHVSSVVQHLGVVRPGEYLSVRGQVIELSTHKGNDYADFDIVILTDAPVMRVRHRAIYRMMAAAAAS
jgi:acyl dehydratase